MSSLKWIQQETVMLLQELPKALKNTGIEALLVDQGTAAGSTVAEFLNVPFITICNALLLNWEPGVPPFFTGWSYSPVW